MVIQRITFIFTFVCRLVHVFWQILYGVIKISKLPPPMITIFGGSRLVEGSLYFTHAYALATLFVEHDISVLTGGGPGAMEAANCGANHMRNPTIRSIGIGVEGLTEKPNKCAQEYFILHYFFARKWLLTRFSKAFIVFPGGVGTFDELFEVLTLIQTQKMKECPVVLFGVSFWTPLVDWLNSSPLQMGLLNKQTIDLLVITDDVKEAFLYVKNNIIENKK